MRTTLIIIILFCLFLISPAYATYKIILKDGATLTWSNYFEEKDKYCTHKSFGKFCISKSDVVSIKEENDSEGTTVIPTKGKSEAEKEKDKPKQHIKEKPEVEKEKVKDKEKLLTEKTFTFEVKNPNIRILIPELPQMNVETHPMAATRPDLRFQGGAHPYFLTIRIPTADAGMTPLECASSHVKSIQTRLGLRDSDISLRKSSDGNTLAMYYPMRMGKVLSLHAHLFSAYGGRYCIDVHISKTPASDAEVKKWLEGFPKAKIESY